jgi:putative chitinase
MIDFRKVLLAVCPHGDPDILDGFAASMERCVDYAALTMPNRLAAFIGQCAEESASFRTTVEYASGRAYNGRRDLGNVESGDGPRFRGRGLIQVTGRANYARIGKAFGVDFVADPAKLAAFPWAALAAADFWTMRGLNRFADSWNIREITHRVNGGFNGLAERELYSRRALSALRDLRGALLHVAGEERNKASIKATVVSLAALPGAGASATAAAHPALAGNVAGYPAAWAAIVGGVALVGAAGALALTIRKHQDAAQALTEAAKNA